MPHVRIENWTIVAHKDGPVLPPSSARGACLQGTAFGHPSYPPKAGAVNEGTFLTTSNMAGLGREPNVVQCGSRTYQLGKVDPNYEELYPNARELLLQALAVPPAP